jgi:hypothetical protein
MNPFHPSSTTQYSSSSSSSLHANMLLPSDETEDIGIGKYATPSLFSSFLLLHLERLRMILVSTFFELSMTTADGTAKRRRRVTDTVENLTRERSDDTSNGDSSKKKPEFVVAPLTALCVAALTRNLDHIPYLGIGYIIANATVSPSCCV